MQRISVDLPDPEGPQMTMRSPMLSVRLMSFSSWKLTYHLWSATISIDTSSPTVNFFVGWRISSSAKPSVMLVGMLASWFAFSTGPGDRRC